MSYDVALYLPAAESFETPWGEQDRASLSGSDCNCTSNVAPMWRRAGFSFRDFADKPAGEAVEPLQSAIARMKAKPDVFRELNPDNGWGDYEGALEYLEHFERWCRAFPQALLYVSS